MLEPGAVAADRQSGALVDRAGLERFHRDALVDRTDDGAQIAADAFLFHHLEMTLAVLLLHDRLMRGILAGDMAATALDAQILVDLRLDRVVEIEMLPVGQLGHRRARQKSFHPKEIK